MAKIHYLILLFFGLHFLAEAQNKEEYIAACGIPAKGKFLPVLQDSVYYKRERFTDYDFKRICLIPEDICNNGNPISLVQWLKENPFTKVELRWHTDIRGNEAYNKKFSERHAETLRLNLIKEGIEPSRLVSRGMGEEFFRISEAEILKLKTKQEQDSAHRLNRRLEVKILEINYKNVFAVSDQYFFVDQTLEKNLADPLSRNFRSLFVKSNPTQQDISAKDSALRIINILAVFLQTHPQIVIEIGVHCETAIDANTASASTLSEAKAIADNLISKGVKASQVSYTGFGNSKPIHSSWEINKQSDPLLKNKMDAENVRLVVRIKKC